MPPLSPPLAFHLSLDGPRLREPPPRRSVSFSSSPLFLVHPHTQRAAQTHICPLLFNGHAVANVSHLSFYFSSPFPTSLVYFLCLSPPDAAFQRFRVYAFGSPSTLSALFLSLAKDIARLWTVRQTRSSSSLRYQTINDIVNRAGTCLDELRLPTIL